MAPHTQPSDTPPIGMKLRTARTLKWNAIDRVSSQVLYAVTGVVLANLLSKEDFGLVGALLVFQAFGILFVDSGFGSALLQKKEPTARDYSTVFWFNLMVATGIYGLLFLCAPLIAEIFQGDTRLIPLSRVMFLSFVLNGLGLVQTTRLMKEMDVKRIAIANTLGLILSGAIGIILAIKGAGAWAIVWQTVTLSAVKTGFLWFTGKWMPRDGFHLSSLRTIWRVGLSVFSSSALNTFFLYIYNFVIGAWYSLQTLGLYTQADKWSKMGSASISQVLTASFVPLLSRFQDDSDNFKRYATRINRFAAFIIFPALGGLAAIGTPLFHTLFGTKWDAAIPLFQILAGRGILVVLISLYTNYILALGHARQLIVVEVVKDALVLLAVGATVWMKNVEALVWGQLGASLLTYIYVWRVASRACGLKMGSMLANLLPFMGAGLLACSAALGISLLEISPIVQLLLGVATGFTVYLAPLLICRVYEPREAFTYLAGRFLRKKRHCQ